MSRWFFARTHMTHRGVRVRYCATYYAMLGNLVQDFIPGIYTVGDSVWKVNMCFTFTGDITINVLLGNAVNDCQLAFISYNDDIHDEDRVSLARACCAVRTAFFILQDSKAIRRRALALINTEW